MKKLLYIALGIALTFAGTVYAVQISVPSSNGSGFLLQSLSNGTYSPVSLTAGSNITISTTTSGITISSTGGGSSFPFTVNSWGNSTTTTLGFLNGFLSTASSTISAPLRLSSLGQGLLYTGSTGLVQPIATTSVTCSGTVTCTGFTVIGASPITINGSSGTSASSTLLSDTNYWSGRNVFTNSTTTNFGISNIYAIGSGGIDIHSNNGTPVAGFGGGGGANATIYGGLNVDGTTRLATGLTGLLKASSGTVSTASNGTDYTLITGTTCSGSDRVSAITAGGIITCSATGGSSASTTLLSDFNTWTGRNIFGYASSTGFSSVYSSSTNGYFGNLNIGNLTGVLKASSGSVSASNVDLTTEVTGVLPVLNGGTGLSTIGGTNTLLYTNASDSITNSPEWVADSVPYIDPSNQFQWLNAGGEYYVLTAGAGGAIGFRKLDISDYTNLTATYPLTLSGNTLGLSFGTTTNNIWSGLQTFTNSSTTIASFNYASTTNLFGAGLTACDPTTGKLLWSSGVFTCGTDQTGGGGFSGASDSIIVSNSAGNALVATSSYPLYIGALFATTTTGTSNILGGMTIGTTTKAYGTSVLTVSATTTGGINALLSGLNDDTTSSFDLYRGGYGVMNGGTPYWDLYETDTSKFGGMYMSDSDLNLYTDSGNLNFGTMTKTGTPVNNVSFGTNTLDTTTGSVESGFVSGSSNIIRGATNFGVIGASNTIKNDYGTTPNGVFIAGYGNYINCTDSISLGYNNRALCDGSGNDQVVIGNWLKASSTGSHVIGRGFNSSNLLTNTQGSSLYVGYDSDIPTFVVTTSVGGVGTVGNIGIGTTTPEWLTQISGVGGKKAQLALSDSTAGSNLKHWVQTSQGGNFYLSTSSDTYATSTLPAFRLDSNGFPYFNSLSSASGNTCLQIDTTGKITNTGSACGGSGTSAYEIATTSTIAIPQLAYFTNVSGRTTLGSVATGTVSAGTGISLDSSVRSVIGGNLQITNNSPLSGLTTSFPLSFSNPALSWIGLATSSNLTNGRVHYSTGVNTFADVATSSIANGTGITVTNGSSAYVLGSQPTINCNTASASVFGCLSASDFSKFNSATTTFSTGLTYTGATNAVTVNTSQNISTLSNLTSNGYIKTSGGTGALSVQAVPIPIADGGTNSTSYASNVLLGYNGTSFIATGTPQLTVGNLLATSSTATSTVRWHFEIGSSTLSTATCWLCVTAQENSPVQVQVQNKSSGSSASSDFVATADNGSDTTRYVNMGINGSGGGSAPFTTANHAYLYSIDDPLNIGALGASSFITFNVTGGTSPVERMRITSATTTLSSSLHIGTTTATAQGSATFSVKGVMDKVAQFFTSTGTKIMEIADNGLVTLLGAWDFGGADSLEIPNGTSNTSTQIGQVFFDTTDNQLVIATSTVATNVAIPLKTKLWSGTIASTSIDFISGGRIPLNSWSDGVIITEIRCQVDGGTSKAINLDTLAGGANTDSVTCATTETSDTAMSANYDITAGTTMAIELGATTGTVDYVTFSVWGYVKRE